MRPHTGSNEARHISAAEAAGLVHSGHWVDYGVSLGQPDVFDKALAARKAELSNVKLRSCISMKPRAVLEADPEGERFFWFSTGQEFLRACDELFDLVVLDAELPATHPDPAERGKGVYFSLLREGSPT
jgi:Acetyl-CoA hydrolase/transferase N-terminal domain